MRAGARFAAGLAMAAGPVAAHEVPGLNHHTLWSAWSGQAWLWLLWGLPGLLVLLGIARLWRQAGAGSGVSRGQASCFLLGWLALGASLLSPLDALGEQLFSAHMLQHELVMLVAAPLLVLGRPLGALVWGLPTAWRPGSAVLARRLGLQAAMRVLTRPAIAWLAHAGTLWIWHAPLLFQAAVRHQPVHDTQHISFLLGALVFWWALLEGRGGSSRQVAGVFYLFTTLVHTSVLGALLTFATRPWYPVYGPTAPAWGLAPLEDQQLGGLIMWVPGGIVYLAAGLALCAALLGSHGPAHNAPAVPKGLP